jgi:dTDP-4-dehydrorhamnose reductase
MKILLFGAGGQVGTELCARQWPAGYQIVATDRVEIDITEREAVVAAIDRERPDIAINAAAYTAVDRAESERDAAWAINCAGPGHIAAACRAAGIPLLHISTDYVYSGDKIGPWCEDDPVSPLGVYGASKEAGDRAVRDALAEHVILRTAWVCSAHGHNFVKTMLRLADTHPSLRVVADQYGCPTAAADIATALATVVERVVAGEARWGTYHFAGTGAATWHDFAEAIFELAAPWRGPPPPVAAITTADFPTPARRPANSVLDCTRIAEAYGIVAPPWKTSLGAVIRQLYEGVAKQCGS